MRFNPTFIVGVFATVAAAQSSTASAPATSVSLDPAQASTIACIEGCPAEDVNCKAQCVGVPFPSEGQANTTNTCAAECPKGTSEADTIAWGECVAACIGEHYWTSGAGTPKPTSGSGSGSGSGSNPTGVTTGTGTGASNPTGSGTGSQSSPTSTGAADAIRVGSSAVGLFGFLAAVMAI